MFSTRLRRYSLALTTLILTGLSGIGHSQSSAWQTRSPMPTGRYGAPAAVIDGKLYVAGGCCLNPFDPFPTRTDVLEVYDPGTDQWTEKAPMPEPWYGGASGVINGKWYLAGGQPCCSNSSTLHIYDPAVDAWTTGAALPQPTGAAMGGVIGGKFYVAGGMDPGNFFPVADLRAYDPTTNAWEQLAPMPTARESGAAAVIDGKLYVVGGGDQLSLHNELEIYDPATGRWASGPPMPTRRYGLSAVAFQGLLYAVGGDNNVNFLQTVEVYNPATQQWFAATEAMPEAHGWAATEIIDGTLHVIGGYNNLTPIGTAHHAGTLPLPAIPLPTTAVPTLVITGGTFIFDGQQHPVTVSALGVHGEPVQGSYSVFYSPGGSAPPFGGGTYSATVMFTSSDPGYTNATVSAPNVITILSTAPTIAISGGTFTFDGQQHPVNVSAFGAHGEPVPGFYSVSYSPGGFAAPFNAGTYSASVTFTSSDPAYSNGTASASNVVTILKADSFVTVSGGTFTYDGFTHQAIGSATGLGGGTVFGTFSFDYAPGGSTAPRTVGTYAVIGTFTPSGGSNYNGGSAAATIQIKPSPANISGPQSVTAEATGPTGAIPTFFVNAFDRDGSLTPVCSPLGPGARFPLGTTQVTCSAQGPNSSPATISFPVTVRDTQAPSIGSVNSITVSATSSQGAIVVFDLPTVTDVADPHPTVSASPASGSTFHHGTTSVTITARDASGNAATRSFSVTVNPSLVSVGVSPQSATVNVGGTRQFSATGTYTDGTTTPLSSGSSGGSGGSGPLNSAWQARFVQGLRLGACVPGFNQLGLSSQAFSGNSSGAVDTTWVQSLHVTGTITLAAVDLTIACTSVTLTPIALHAVWTGTRYQGSLIDFTGAPVDVVITGWSTKTPMPTPRFALGSATLSVNGRSLAYAVGGASGTSLLGTVEAYDPSTETWSPVAPLPTPREGAGVVALNNNMYVVGGNRAGGAPTGVVEVFDPATGAWTAPLPPLTTPRAHFSLVSANGKLYAIGGTTAANNAAVTASVEVFDLLQPSLGWVNLAPMPTPRGFTAGGAINGGATIVVVGGQQVNGPALSRVEIYTVATSTWAQGPSMLAPTSGPAAIVVSNALWVFGGNNNGPLILAEMYRPASGAPPNQIAEGWAGLSGMPTPRGEATAAAVGDVVYVIGGQGNGSSAQTGLSTLEAFSLLSPEQFSVTSGSSSGGGSTTPTVSWHVAPASGIATIDAFGNAVGNAVGQATVIAEAGGLSCMASHTCGALTVSNRRPQAQIFQSSVTIDAGTNLSSTGIAGSFFDGDAGQTWTATVNYGDGAGAVALGLTAGSGNQGPTGTFTLDHVYTHPGEFNVVVTVTDSVNESGQAFLHVSVVDRTPPVLSLPSNLSAEATSAAGAAVSYVATAMDAIDGPVDVLCSRPAGSTFPLGTTHVTCSATDHSGNVSSGSFDVTVADTTAPAIGSVTPSVAVISPPNHKMVPLTIAVQVTDAVTVSPSCGITSVSSNEAANAAGDGNTAVDWTFTPGTLTLSLRAERSGTGQGRVYTIAVSCADAAGNRASSSTEVRVPK